MIYKQIEDLFTDSTEAMYKGLQFSGVKKEGEYKRWLKNGQLRVHCFYIENELDGIYKEWQVNGNLYIHRLYKENKIIKDYPV